MEDFHTISIIVPTINSAKTFKDCLQISWKHRLENPGLIPLQIIEVQNGDYVEEDDIERFDDEYQRVKK